MTRGSLFMTPLTFLSSNSCSMKKNPTSWTAKFFEEVDLERGLKITESSSSAWAAGVANGWTSNSVGVVFNGWTGGVVNGWVGVSVGVSNGWTGGAGEVNGWTSAGEINGWTGEINGWTGGAGELNGWTGGAGEINGWTGSAVGSEGLLRTVISVSRRSSVSLWYLMHCFCCSDICVSSPRTSGWLSARLPNRLRGTVRPTGETLLASCGKPTLKRRLTGVAVDCWMNPIENLWHELKHFLRTTVKPRNKEELVAGIQRFWGSVTPEKCQRYIDHLQKVIPAVVEREGRASGY